MTEFSAIGQFGRRWGWYSAIYGLAGGDFLKFDAVTDQPLTAALTFLTFEKQKQKLETQMIKK